MQLTFQNGYPDYVGKRFIYSGFGVGPKSYSQTTGDAIQLPRSQNYIDTLQGSISISGTYEAIGQPKTKGNRPTWIIRYYVVSTGAEVANAVDLSAETFNVSGFGGVY